LPGQISKRSSDSVELDAVAAPAATRRAISTAVRGETTGALPIERVRLRGGRRAAGVISGTFLLRK
jgi:hypothetical protein